MTPNKSKPKRRSAVWELLISVKLTVAVLLTIAATAVIGTVVPQNRPDAFYQMKFENWFYLLADRLDLFNMYHSFWFQALILILAVNILACSLNRLKIVWKIVFPRQVTFSAGAFKSDMATDPVRVPLAPEQLAPVMEKKLGRRFSRTALEQTQDGFYFFGERGRLSRLGVYVVHVSVLLLLGGALVSSFFGLDGNVNILEGETVRTISLQSGGQPHPLGFGLRCDDFQVSFYDSGRPKKYRSTLSVIKSGQVVLTRDIEVNQPLRYEGVNVFQSSYDKASIKTVELSFTSKNSGLTYHRQLKMGQTITLPENLGTFTLQRFTASYLFKGRHDIGNTLIGLLKKEGRQDQVIALPLRGRGFDRMRGGEMVMAVEDFEPRYYTGLRITRDPGVPLVYAAFILMIAGIYISFFRSHQRFCFRGAATGDETTVTVWAKANKNDPAALGKARRWQRKIEQLAASELKSHRKAR